MNEHCSIDSSHIGPFALYLWKEEGKKGFEHRRVLCQKCAARVGAWKLPAKEEQKEIEIADSEQQ